MSPALKTEINFFDEIGDDAASEIVHDTAAQPIAYAVRESRILKHKDSKLPLHVRNLVTQRNQSNSYKAVVGSYLQGYASMSKGDVDPHLEDTGVIEKVNEPGVREMAWEIKKYYRQRFMLDKLGGVSLNAFNTDMFEYVTRNNDGAFKTSEIGLISSLPSTYQCDTELDRCMEMCDTSDMNQSATDLYIARSQPLRSGVPIHAEVTAELIGGVKPMGQGYTIIYYFRDVDTKRLIQVPLEDDSLFDLLIDTACKNPYFDLGLNNARVLNSRNNFIINSKRTGIRSADRG